MTLTKTLLRYISIVLLLVFLSQSRGYAGGFPIRPGRLLISPSISYFSANKQWDSTGILKPFPQNGKFSSITTTLYVEYGISRRWSFVGSLPYTINDYHQDNYHPGKISGLTDLETGIKYYVANIAYQYFFTVQGTVITPLYTNTNLGYAQSGGEFKAAFAGSGMLFNRNYFFNLEDGIRKYLGTIGPLQNRYSATFGLSLDKKLRDQVSVSYGGFHTTSKYNTPILNQYYTSSNFSFQQVTLSYGHTFDRQLTLLLSGGKFLNGRNTGDGSSLSLSLIYHIDTR